VDLDTLHKNPHSTLLVLQAIVDFVYLTLEGARVLRQLAISIDQLDYFAVDGTSSLHLLRDNRDAKSSLAIITRGYTNNDNDLPIFSTYGLPSTYSTCIKYRNVLDDTGESLSFWPRVDQTGVV
jgi:hypothetical protein